MLHKLPRLALTIEPAAGDPLDLAVQADNRGACAYDLVRSAKGYPAPADAPFLWMTYLAYHALRRTGQLAAHQLSEDFDQFRLTVAQLVPVDESGDRVELADVLGENVDPTQPAT
ncbi:hypothetical protein HJ590_12115 [Naumannella sp. ID2617S]|nr:hypothetical protein [Naumannella sp. ID2617S]